MQKYQESYIILWKEVSQAIDEINKQNIGRALGNFATGANRLGGAVYHMARG